MRFIGDPVAAVAAIDEDVAFDAMNLIEVEYERLNTISSIEEALLIDEPRIHEYGDGGNVHKKVSLEFGDVEEGFAEADLDSRRHVSSTKATPTCRWSNTPRLLISIRTTS